MALAVDDIVDVVSRDDDEQTFGIGQVADRFGLVPTTIRYCERRGLIDIPRNSRSRVKVLGASELARIRLLMALTRESIPIDAIRAMPEMDDAGRRKWILEAAAAALDSIRRQVQHLLFAVGRFSGLLTTLDIRDQDKG